MLLLLLGVQLWFIIDCCFRVMSIWPLKICHDLLIFLLCIFLTSWIFGWQASDMKEGICDLKWEMCIEETIWTILIEILFQTHRITWKIIIIIIILLHYCRIIDF